MNTETALHFDGWTVNPVSGEIMRNGKARRLQQLPLRILLELCERPGAVVTREQLVKALWPGGFVDFDNGLNVAVRKLRVALEDVGEQPKYIETLPRVGYRFIGSLGAGPAPPVDRAAVADSRPLPLAVFLAALIAVLAGLWWWISGPPTWVAGVPKGHVPSVRARELYLEGLHQRARRDISILTASAAAHEKFTAALKEDPDYPQAWAAVSATYFLAVNTQSMLPAEGVPKARAAALRAIELDDELAEGHVALGAIYLRHDHDFPAAKRELDRALQIDDRYSRAWQQLAIWHADIGQVDEALAALRRARELDPMTLQWSSNQARVLYVARRYDEVIELLTPLVAANPKLDPAHSILAWALIAKGDLAGAEAQLRLVTVPTINPSDRGYLLAKQGRRVDALREIEQLEARGRSGYGVGYDQAIIYSALGDIDQACEALARAVDDQSLLLGWMRLDPRLDPLRGRQCFTSVERRVYPR